MTVARTYFFNRMADNELAGLCGAKDDFFLENIDDLESAVARIRAMLKQAGMRSEVEHAPLNAAPGIGDLLSAVAPAVGLIWASVRALESTGHPRADATLRVTSNSSLSVVFSRAPRPPTAQ